MDIKKLEKCLHLIGYWLNEDKTVIKKILSIETQISQDYIKPFIKELNKNLLSKDTIESKRDLLKYYIFEFWELQGFYRTHKEILFNGGLCNYSPVKYKHTDSNGKNRKLNEFENYVVNSYFLFEIIFDEIQICCLKYKIDFYELCDELNFSTEYFDSGITILFEELKHSKTVNPVQISENEDDNIINRPSIRQKIEKAFRFMQFDDPRKHKKILKDKDFKLLVNWITYYFENNFKLPEIKNPIENINTNKGNVIYTFKLIFKKLHPSKPRPNNLFELIKLCFYDYRNDNIENFKKQKEPQYYKKTIGNYE